MIKIEKYKLKGRYHYNLCECDECGASFERRSSYKGGKKIGAPPFSLCRKCADLASGKYRGTHGEGMKNSRLYVVWQNMKRRCLDKSNSRYKKYGGRGIKICRDWESYAEFSEWARSNGYTDDLTIDRIDNNGDYCPENCRFVDKSYQNANRGAIRTNSSGFVGVWYKSGRYQARVQFKGSIHEVGRFHTLIDAVKARDKAIKDFGYPNQLSGIECMRLCDIEKQDREYREYLKREKNIK